MNVQCFILLEIVARLYYVVSYTVVLKQIKPLYSPVKVYRYDLRHPKILSDVNVLYPYKTILSQKIYPIRPRGVKKKEAKYVKSLSTDKPFQKDGKLYEIAQQLVPPLSNQTVKYSEAKEAAEEEEALKEDVDVRPLPVLPPQEKSFASFGQEKGKIYKSAGEWAAPVTNENSDNTTPLAFTPSQLYLQIRHKNTVIHVPQSEALKDSETLEELINAPRLKELARTTHVQETYSEEGYEDTAYDHAGQIRQAQHGEIYDAKDEGKFKIKEAPVILNYDSDLEESKKAPLKNLKGTETKANPQEDIIIKLEPRITQSGTELRKTGVEYNKDPPASYKGEHIFSSRVKIKKLMSNNDSESVNSMSPVTFPSFFGEMALPPDKIFTNDSVLTHMRLPMKMSSKYRKENLNSTKIYPVRPPTNKPYNHFTDFKPFISATDSQSSPSAKSLKYNRIYSKKTKQLRLEPYKSGNVYTSPPPSDHLQPPVEEPEEHINQRIVLPTIGYINSLTTAHFGKDVLANVPGEPKAELTSALNLTQALNYLRSKNNQKILEEPKFFNETDLKTFEPMRLKKQRLHYRNFASKTKRDVHLIKEQDSVSEESEYESNDERDLPHNDKNLEILEDEGKRIEEENREKEKFEAELREELMAKEQEIIKEGSKHITIDSPKSFPENFFSEVDFHYVKSTTPTSVDLKKYPFYRSKILPENSPLRYASDPVKFPRKSGHGMEFYESRERVIQCPDFHPDFTDHPNSNSTKYSDNQLRKNQRLTSLGDKISCLRSKYFDPEPFDNPIFKEREINYVGKPKNDLKKVIRPQTEIATKHGKPLEAYKKSTSAPITKKGSKIVLISTERPFKSQQVSESAISQHKVNQHLLPTRIFPFLLVPKTASTFVKPVSDIPKWFLSLAGEPAAKIKPPVIWKTILLPQSTLLEPAKIILRENCMHFITKLTVFNGASNRTIECNDGTFVQEIINGVAYIRIIPKERWSAKISSERPPKASDWVPIIGYAASNFTKPGNRKTDETTIPKNETTEKPSSDQYVIDELKEDKNVRQGEVVEDIDHYLRMTDSVKITSEGVKKKERRKREVIDLKFKKGNRNGAQRPTGAVVFDAIEKLTQAQVAATDKTNETAKTTFSKLFETKRTLGRLSGRDFLTRYHKNKSKPKAADFWKIVSTNKNLQNLEKTIPANSSGKISREKSTSNVPSVTSTSNEKPMGVEELGRTKFGSSDFKTVTPITIITGKFVKKPQNEVLENASQMNRSFENPEKNITEMSKELSESSKKAITVDKKNESMNVKEKIMKTSNKPQIQYKTINRSRNNLKKAEEENSSSDSPTLYYVMDVRTGRGEWISNYEEQRRSRIFRERGKLKGNIERRYKKQKKTKY